MNIRKGIRAAGEPGTSPDPHDPGQEEIRVKNHFFHGEGKGIRGRNGKQSHRFGLRASIGASVCNMSPWKILALWLKSVLHDEIGIYSNSPSIGLESLSHFAKHCLFGERHHPACFASFGAIFAGWRIFMESRGELPQVSIPLPSG